MTAQTKSPTLKLERTFDATPLDLWGAWTDPKQYARWFNPAPGIDLVIHEFDVRVGGKIRFDMPQPDGNRNPQEGVFLELSRFTRILSGAPDRSFLIDTRFVPVDKTRTRMVVEVTGVPPEYHAGATQGWNAGFDKLERVLREPKATKTLRIERMVDAAPERVYAAWTDAGTIAKWFSPIPGVDANVRRLDVRVGGRGHVTVKPPEGDEFGFFLHFLKLQPPREIVRKCTLTEDDADAPAVTIRFEPQGQRTRMTFVSPDIPEGVYNDAAGGWNAFFDKLERVVDGRGAA